MVMVNHLFLGNPGTGKSTLINCLVGHPHFDSGLSYGGGRTNAFQKHLHDNVQYLDTPGLADRSIQDKAADEITQALKQSGKYKLFFIIRLENGRVVNDDLATIEVVLRSIGLDNIPFAVIVNNVKKRQHGEIMKKEHEYDRVVTLIKSTRYKTQDIVFIPMIDELDEKDNAVTNLPSDVEKFIRSGTPTVEIDPQNVQAIEIEDFHKVSQRLREMQENLLKQNVLLERKLEEVSKKRNSIDALLAPTQDDDNLQTAEGGYTRDSTTEATISVLPERIGNPQWGETFPFVPETEAKRVVNTSGCQNWIWATFKKAKNYVMEKLKRPWNKLKNWWKPQ